MAELTVENVQIDTEVNPDEDVQSVKSPDQAAGSRRALQDPVPTRRTQGRHRKPKRHRTTRRRPRAPRLTGQPQRKGAGGAGDKQGGIAPSGTNTRR